MSVERNDPSPLVITREYKAPRTLVFEAWSKAEHLEKWFGPDGFTVTCSIDFRTGGKMELTMEGYGMKNTVHGVYRQIVPNERIEWVFTFDDIPGHDIPTTITFEDAGPGKTRLSVKQVFPQYAALTPAQQELLRPRVAGSSIGWGQTLDHLGQFVEK